MTKIDANNNSFCFVEIRKLSLYIKKVTSSTGKLNPWSIVGNFKYSLAFLNSHSGDLGDLFHDEYGYVNDTRSFDWISMDHRDGILGRSLVVSRKSACLRRPSGQQMNHQIYHKTSHVVILAINYYLVKKIS